jgi:hypothetical protein
MVDKSLGIPIGRSRSLNRPAAITQSEKGYQLGLRRVDRRVEMPFLDTGSYLRVR